VTTQVRLLHCAIPEGNGHRDHDRAAPTPDDVLPRSGRRESRKTRPISLARTGTLSETLRVTRNRCSQSILAGTQRVRRRTANCHTRPPRTNVGGLRNWGLQRLPISANHRREVRALLRLLSRLTLEAANAGPPASYRSPGEHPVGLRRYADIPLRANSLSSGLTLARTDRRAQWP
jgi:hypothetical protein